MSNEPLTHEQICEAIDKLGIDGGWILYGNDIDGMQWLRDDAKPTEAQLRAALTK